MYTVSLSSYSGIGDRKKTNQDSILVKSEVIYNHDVCMLIVADGCGGLQFGEEVSSFIVTYFPQFWQEKLTPLLAEKKVNMHEIDDCLMNGLEQVNQRAFHFSGQVGSRVGSTLTMLVSVDNEYIVKNIGDSRVYRQRKNQITQLTEDQSLVAELVRRGELSKEEAEHHRKKNVLTMCVGAFEHLQVYSEQGTIKDNDTFILCSDGLHNHVSTDTMLAILQSRQGSFEDKARMMRESIAIGEANDNVSAIVCRYNKQRETHRMRIAIMILLMIVLLFILRKIVSSYIMGMLCHL